MSGFSIMRGSDWHQLF